MQKTYVIIGASAAGIAAVQKIRQLDQAARVICFSEESELPYNKCFLADFLGHHKTLFEVYTKGEEFFKILNIELHLGTKIVALDRAEKTVTSSDGKKYSYTALLLAVGAASRNATWRGHTEVKGFFPFYTLRDALHVQNYVEKEKPKNIFVVGAGLTGLEVADALRVSGATITVVEQQPRLLMRHVDKEGADFIAAAMERCSINLMTGVSVQGTVSDVDGRIFEIIFSEGIRKPAAMVIEALGSCARLELAESAHIAVENGAIVTNEFLQTSDPSIFAAGDVALVKNKITGDLVRTALWPDAVAQGMHAGSNMVELIRPYGGVVPVATSTFFSISFHSAGFLEIKDSTWSEKIERTAEGYTKIILDQNRVVKGFICIGDLVSHMVAYKRSLVTETPLSL